MPFLRDATICVLLPLPTLTVSVASDSAGAVELKIRPAKTVCSGTGREEPFYLSHVRCRVETPGRRLVRRPLPSCHGLCGQI